MEAADRKAQTSRKVWEHVRTVAVAVLFALCIRTGLAQAYVVEGPSMEPTLENGERVLVVKYPFGLTLPVAEEAVVTWSAPERGDVVILASPIDGTDLVKRVIGLPGDEIEVRRNVVYLNGQALATGRTGRCDELAGEPCEWREEQHGEHAWRTRFSPGAEPDTELPMIVPEGYVFVMGDHRDRSNDSRYFGAVPVSRLRGRVAFVD